MQSLPFLILCHFVAPHAGAWIEIIESQPPESEGMVAPHAGAWIEIGAYGGYIRVRPSLPMRERGLK